MLNVFTRLEAKTLTLQPKDHQLNEIGHMKFFSKRAKILWPYALQWLDKQ